MNEIILPIVESSDLVRARSQGRDLARAAGLGLADQTRLATAISEVTRNVLKYAGKGTCTLRDESETKEIRVVVEVDDQGPGIPDIDLALTDGYSTGRSLGAGLPGAKRISTEFSISSTPGQTQVRFAITRPRL